MVEKLGEKEKRKGGDIMDVVEMYRRKKEMKEKRGRGRAEKIRQIIREILKEEEYVVVSVVVDIVEEMFDFKKRDDAYISVESAVKTKSSGLKWIKKDGRAVIVKG